MARKKSEAEIDALKQEVKNLGARRPEQEKTTDKTSAESAAEPDQDENPSREEDAGNEHPGLREKIEELSDLLQEQLNQVPATTAIAIFGIGFIFGRLFSGKR